MPASSFLNNLSLNGSRDPLLLHHSQCLTDTSKLAEDIVKSLVMLTLLTHTFLNTGFSLHPHPNPSLAFPLLNLFSLSAGSSSLLISPLLADLTAEVPNLSPP